MIYLKQYGLNKKKSTIISKFFFHIITYYIQDHKGTQLGGDQNASKFAHLLPILNSDNVIWCMARQLTECIK